MEPQEAEALKDELLESRDFSSEEKAEPRRNSKQALIDKIIEISERDNIPLGHSNTKLKRMNKQQLAELCADMIEKGMKRKMARTLGVDEDSDDRCMALGALRMIHDVCAVATERVGDSVLDDYGYTIEGFSHGLKEPTVSSAIDSCLQEIARICEVTIHTPAYCMGGCADFLLSQKTKENNQTCSQHGTPSA